MVTRPGDGRLGWQVGGGEGVEAVAGELVGWDVVSDRTAGLGVGEE
jgi:hypothetical protein